MRFPFDQAFEDAMGRDWSPSADVYRAPSGWVVKYDLAGVAPEDISVALEGSVLRVSGVRRDTFVERGYRHHSMEIAYSRFERALRLPCDAEGAALSVEYRDGMLIVVIETG